MLRNIITLKPTEIQVSEYINNISDITSYTFALTKTSLPILVMLTPDWYGDFSQNLSVAQGHCMEWTKGILTSLQVIPKSIVNFNYILQPTIDSIISNLEMLKTDSKNKDYISKIEVSTKKLKAELEPLEDVILGLDEGLDMFTKQLQTDSKTLANISNEALLSSEADISEINKLNDSIKLLQDLIDNKKQLIILEKGLKLDVTIFISAIKIVIGVAKEDYKSVIKAAISCIKDGYDIIVADEDEVKELQEEIINVQSEMNEVNTSIALLKNISVKFEDLEEKNIESQKSLIGVKNYWKAAVDNMIEMIKILNKLIKDLRSANLDTAINDLKSLSVQWKDLKEFSEVIKDVKYQFVDNSVDIKTVSQM